MADEENALPHDQLIGELRQVGGDVHDAEVCDAVLGQLGQLGHRGLMEHHLHVGVPLGEVGENVGHQGRPPPGGYADVEHRPLVVLEIPQVADQLAVQIALPFQVSVKDLARRS